MGAAARSELGARQRRSAGVGNHGDAESEHGAAIWGYLNETLVHGWDLAVATGQDPEADPELAETSLAIAAVGVIAVSGG